MKVGEERKTIANKFKAPITNREISVIDETKKRIPFSP